MIIDTHCHLDDESFDSDLAKVIANARENGVGGVLIPGADINDLPKAAKITHEFENVFFAVGVHPYDKDGFDKDVLYKFAKDENEKELEKAEQKRVFRAQLDMAVELNLPVILHIRDASEDSFNILKEYASRLVGAVLHCYNASPLLLELAKMGEFYFGIGGVLTFKNAKNLVQILPQIPRDRLLLETDAPYLTPEPFRGRRNEPAFTRLVATKMAEILNLKEEEVMQITTKNAKKIFMKFNT